MLGPDGHYHFSRRSERTSAKQSEIERGREREREREHQEPNGPGFRGIILSSKS